MLNENRPPGSVVASMRQARNHGFAGAFLTVEGETDHQFWSAKTNVAHTRIIRASGRKNVEGAVELAIERNIKGVLGLADSDYDVLEPNHRDTANLLYLRERDLESYLLSTNALDIVLKKYADKNKLDAVVAAEGNIRSALASRCRPFSRLRWLAWRHRQVLDISAADGRFLDDQTWAIKWANMDDDFAGKNLLPRPTEPEASEFDALWTSNSWTLCRGHDLIGILLVGLRNALGSQHRLSEGRLVKDLADALAKEIFDEWELCGRIRGWQSRNSPFIILPA